MSVHRSTAAAITERWARAVGVGLALAVLLVVASMSGPVDLWVVSPSGRSSTPDGPSAIDPRPSIQRTSPGDPSHFGEFGVVVIAVVAVVGIGALAMLVRPRSFRVGHVLWRRRQGRQRLGVLPLPEPDAADLSSRLDVARVSLSGGSPRNGVIACWMQLEELGAEVGLERRDAETSAEYVERIVGVTPLASGAISTLAELFREARFSDHHMDEAARERASEALDIVHHELRSETVS